jgi:hypothetical protein
MIKLRKNFSVNTYIPELNRIEKLLHKMEYKWMAFKLRDTKTLDTDVDEILAGFVKK